MTKIDLQNEVLISSDNKEEELLLYKKLYEQVVIDYEIEKNKTFQLQKNLNDYKYIINEILKKTKGENKRKYNAFFSFFNFMVFSNSFLIFISEYCQKITNWEKIRKSENEELKRSPQLQRKIITKKIEDVSFVSYDCMSGYTSKALGFGLTGPSGWIFIEPIPFVRKLSQDPDILLDDMMNQNFNMTYDIEKKYCVGNIDGIPITFHHYIGYEEEKVHNMLKKRINRMKNNRYIYLLGMYSVDYTFSKKEIIDILEMIDNCIIITDYDITHERVFNIKVRHYSLLFLDGVHLVENLDGPEYNRFVQCVDKYSKKYENKIL